MKNIFYSMLILFCGSLSTFAQSGKGIIKGIIGDERGLPLEGISVGLETTKFGNVTDDEGAFFIFG